MPDEGTNAQARDMMEQSANPLLRRQRLAIERALDLRDRASSVQKLRWCAREDREPLPSRGQALLHLRQHARDVARDERVLKEVISSSPLTNT